MRKIAILTSSGDLPGMNTVVRAVTRAAKICRQLEKDFGKYDMKVCILGHVQRVGAPTAHDRV